MTDKQQEPDLSLAGFIHGLRLQAQSVNVEPEAFAKFLEAQPDLGTKWAPRYVRIVAGMPLTATGKVNKQPLRAQRWETDDSLWMREGKDGPYRRMTAADVTALRAEFEARGRAHVLDAM